MRALRSIRDECVQLWAEGKGKYLLAIAGVWAVLLGTRMVYPVLLPYLRESFNLSLTVAGLLVTVLWLGSAIGQLPGGLLADRYSERTIMAIAPIVVACALVFVINARSPLILFLATGFVGVGQSLYPIARITILSDIYPNRIGSALGVTMATGDFGQTVLPPIAGAIALGIAWEMGLGFVIPLLLLGGVVIWVGLQIQASTESAVDSLSYRNAAYVLSELRRSNTTFVSFLLFLYILVWQSFTGFYPTYLVEVKGLSSSAAGMIFSTFFALGMIFKPVSGAAYDRIGLRNSLIIVLIWPMLGFAVLPFIGGFWPLILITALVSPMLGSGAITQSYLSDIFSKDMRGTGLGVVRTTAASLGAIGPVLFGSIAERGYFDEGYFLLAIITAAVILLTLRLSPSSAIQKTHTR